jgi:hypothetical protein
LIKASAQRLAIFTIDFFLSFNDLRNKVVHKSSYRPTLDEVEDCIKETRNIVFSLDCYLLKKPEIDMNRETKLLEKWRQLPEDKQEQVLDFVEFLYQQKKAENTELGEQLRQIRANIVASGEQLLSQEEIEQEMISRRGGLQDNISK